MRKAALITVSVCMAFALTASGCAQNTQPTASGKSAQSAASGTLSQGAAGESSAYSGEVPSAASSPSSSVTAGKSTYRGFVIDNVLHSDENGDIHYSVYVPESYDGSKPYALYFTLPGYEGLYFQGVAQNLKSEDFGFEAQKYNKEMIIVAPQLSDWGETSANQTIELVEYFLENYNIDRTKVFANGYSGGGITNLSFLQENLIDELSLVIAPVADGGRGSSIFDRANLLPYNEAVPFELINAQNSDEGTLWLRYRKKGGGV